MVSHKFKTNWNHFLHPLPKRMVVKKYLKLGTNVWRDRIIENTNTQRDGIIKWMQLEGLRGSFGLKH